MKKALWLGVGSGVLVLAALGAYWLKASTPATDLAATPLAAGSDTAASPVAGDGNGAGTGGLGPSDPAASLPPGWGTAQNADAGKAPWSSSVGAAPATAASTLTREERRQVRAQIRAKLAELQAKGQNVTLAETQVAVADIERLARGTLDPRYFGLLRDTLTQAARVQDLSRELTQVAQSTKPNDVVRKQAILAEMRELSFRLTSSSKALQAYAREGQGSKG